MLSCHQSFPFFTGVIKTRRHRAQIPLSSITIGKIQEHSTGIRLKCADSHKSETEITVCLIMPGNHEEV